MDLVSIIVPVYNVEKYLDRCVNSLLNQSYKNIEIILVNDGSTDNSPNLCNKYADLDTRVRVINQKNQGTSIAKISGLTNSFGKYILFVDSDDYVPNNFVEVLYNLMIEYDVKLVVCDVEFIYSDGTSRKMLNLEENFVLNNNEEIMGNLVSIDGGISNYLWNKMYDKKLLNNDILNVKHNFEDVVIMYKILENVDKIVCTSDTCYQYMIRTNSLSHSFKADFSNFILIDSNIKKYLGIKAVYPSLSRNSFHQLAIATIYYYNVAISQNNPFNFSAKQKAKEIFYLAKKEKYYLISKVNFIKLYLIAYLPILYKILRKIN